MALPMRRAPAAARVVASTPGSASLYRLDPLVASLARRTLWLTDAYFAGTSIYVQALRAAAEDGVDVRLLVPGPGSDIPLVQAISRAGYRALLRSGVRVFEWNGPMLHAKTAVADARWARVGSTNLNLSSWVGNRELDLVIENEAFGQAMEEMFALDLTNSTEIVLEPRHRVRPAGGVRFEPEGDLRGEWDGDRIAQLLSNLLRNAVQHGAASDPITLRARGDGDDVTLEVHNGGPAIPPGVLATMFEPMVRHDGGDRANTGLGLGLYIASQVALAHGGAVGATSTDVDGTCFTVRLPRRVAVERPARKRRRQS